MHIQGEPVHAFCPLISRRKERNMAYLTDESFIILRMGRLHHFEKEKIQHISWRNRMYLIPIISGGIMAPLGIVSLINDLGYLWLVMLIIFAGLLLLYYGFQGGPAISVFTSVKDYDIFVPSVSPQLKSFVAYVNWRLKSTDDFLYLTLTDQERENAIKHGVGPGNKLYLSMSEVPPVDRENAFKIDTREQQVELRFQQRKPDSVVEIFLDNTIELDFLREL